MDGTGGALSGAALGEVDDIIRNGLTGICVGDAIGSIPGKVTSSTISIGKTIKSERDTMRSFADTMASVSEDSKKYINARKSTIQRNERAKVEFERMQKRIIDAGNLD